MYGEFVPPSPLSALLECLWFSSEASLSPRLILPDACEDILLRIHPQQDVTFDVVGLMSTFQWYYPQRSEQVLGLRFRAGMLSLLFSHHPQSLLDCVEPLKNYQPSFYVYLAQTVSRYAKERPVDVTSRAFHLFLCRGLLQWLHQSPPRPSKLQQAFLNQSPQPVKGLSHRQLQRYYLQDIGVTPHRFQRYLRFRRVWEALQANPPDTLAELAHAQGYADQSHLNHEFRHFAGCTPTQYVRFLQDPDTLTPLT
jgi:hypothetical protein